MEALIHRLIRLAPDEYVFGATFRQAESLARIYEETKDKLDFVESYQRAKLKLVLTLAQRAYYYRYLADYNDIKHVPFTDKNLMLNQIDSFIVSKKRADVCRTSGTTSGTPFKFYIDKSRKGFEWFWMAKYNWGQVGFSMNDYRAALRNHKLNGSLHQVNYLRKEVQFDNHDLKDSYCDYILDYIEKHNIKFVHAYPSAAFILAKRIRTTNRTTPIKVFLTGSETVLSCQKDLIQNQLKKRMFSWYGHSEKLILAAEKADCENYHVNPFYGYAEIVDDSGNIVSTPGQSGELIGTGFINTRMPFIRYKTDDRAKFLGNVCPNCGHIGLTFGNLIGRRTGEMIYKDDGSLFNPHHIVVNYGLFKHIKGLQCYQKKKGELIIRVVPHKGYNKASQENIIKILLSVFRDGLTIKIEEVDSLEYTKNNKLKLLIQDIQPDMY